MKKYILSLAAAMTMAGSMTAQADGPNRMLVVSPNQSYKSYLIDYVDQIQFRTVEGEVAADVKILDHTLTEATLTVTRTPDCESFMINVIPGIIARQLEANPSGAESYLNSIKSPTYYEDFTSGKMKGLELSNGTEYAVVTLGFDGYNTACNFTAAYFTTDPAPVVGDPQVAVEVTSTDYTSIGLKLTPNNDAPQYYFVLFGEGEAQSQLEMFGPMLGCENLSQLVMRFGALHVGVEDYTYTGLDPNTNYELYVLPIDREGTSAPLQITPMATKAKGGPGAAKADIRIDAYKLTDWDGQMMPTLCVTFTPNDQTWAYRTGVFKADGYDKDREEILKELASNPPMPMAYWFQYDTFYNEYQVAPGTEIVLVTVAKNGNGEWGEPNEMRYTTPAMADPAAKAAAVSQSVTVPARVNAQKRPNRIGLGHTMPGVVLLKK